MSFFVKSLPLMVALVLASACGDDDDDKGATNQCTAGYSDKTPAELEAETTSGACADDTATICANNVPQQASDCGVAARKQATDPNDLMELGSLTLSCLQTELDPAPSNPCLGCYIQSVACAAQNCLNDCAGGETAACQQCRISAGCTTAFYQCSGLPVPTGLDVDG
jgi:hypothetical protein